MTYTMHRDLFLQELETGSKWAEYAAKELTAKGIPCKATEMRIAQSEAEVQDFTENDQDVVLLDGSGHFEVKSRRLTFTNHLNYPFDTVFVDTVSGWQQKKVKPIAYLIVSQETGAIVVVPSNTASEWKTTTTFDRIRKFTDTWLTAHRHQMLTLKEFVEEYKEEHSASRS
jgi:4-hydroxy-3-methylbut-2-enyl diphosphate reductase IspH